MEGNVGSTDRLVRAVLGALLTVVGLAGFGGFLTVGTHLGALVTVIGVVLLGTAVLRLCILYEILNIRTTP